MPEIGRMVKKSETGFVLMVSLPVNDHEMAKAAEEGGADGIKTHLNVSHYASGTNFKSWKEEKANIEKILSTVKIPVGILPGAEFVAAKEEIIEAKQMGIDFLDAFAHQMPLYLSEIDGLGLMLAVNRDYTPIHIQALEFFGMNMMEATILPHEEYGSRLTMRDLALYRTLAGCTSRPLIIPTQKNIQPEEIPILRDTGARGIVIGAVVTGKSAEGVYKTTKAFREAIAPF